MNEAFISFKIFRTAIFIMATLFYLSACGGGDNSTASPPPSSGGPNPPPVVPPPTPTPIIEDDNIFIIYKRSVLEVNNAISGIIKVNDKKVSEKDYYYIELDHQIIYVLSKSIFTKENENYLHFEIPTIYNELTGLASYIYVNISNLSKDVLFTSVYHTAVSDIIKNVKSEGLNEEQITEFFNLDSSLNNFYESEIIANTSFARSLLDKYLSYASSSDYEGMIKTIKDISNAAQNTNFTVEGNLAKLTEKNIEIEDGAVLALITLCPNKIFNGIVFLQLTDSIDLKENDENCLYKYAFCYENSEGIEPSCGSFKETKLTKNYNKETTQTILTVRDEKTDQLFLRATELSLGKPNKVRQIVYCALLRENNYSCEN